MASSEQDNCARNKPGYLTLEQRIAVIRELNDQFRTSGVGGRFMLTPGIMALGASSAAEVIGKVRNFTEFTSDNDPYGEHDMGGFKHGNERIFWKIDYYDETLEAGSSDPSKPEITTRVLTIMLACEY